MSEAAPLCGFLNVLKPPGMSSAQVVGYVRWLMKGAKIGHAGTLDPEAAGVLPLMVGKAARLFDYMQDKEKAYVTEVAFGCSTTTQDAQGQGIEYARSYPTEEQIRSALPSFIGQLMQRPPMFSALKQNGTPLYKLARQGMEAEIPARPVTVHSLEFRGMTENHGALLAVHCSKGFYVRTLCHDLGQALHCPSHMRFLLRSQSGPFTLETACTLEDVAQAAREDRLAQRLLPPEAALGHLEMMTVPRGLEKAVCNGLPLPWQRFAPWLQNPDAPFGLRLNGQLTAIAQRRGELVKIRTWLG